jgi:cytochrome c oxidase cbb3-type subunit 2
MPPVSSGLRWTAAGVTATLVVGIVVATLAETAPASPLTDVKRLYDSSCASCHGTDGRGSGPAADALTPAPRDFTRGTYKFRSTTSGSIPTDDDLYRAIAGGLPGTSMLGWKGILSETQIRGLIVYVKQFSPRFASDQPNAVTPSRPIAPSPDSLAKGRQAYDALACGACHGDTGTGEGAVAAGLKDDWGHDVHAANLTEPWTFRGGATATDIYLRLRTGINGTPMPSIADTASDQDLWHIANYVTSLARKPVWQLNVADIKSLYRRQAQQDAANPVARGRVLVATLGCAHCHSPVDREGRILPGMKYAGGLTMRLVVWGDFVTANLTSDNETGLGRYSDDDIRRAFTRGIKRDDTHMLPFPMGWPSFAHLTPADQNAVVAFLRTIPPVRNQIPPPTRPGLVTYLTSKFQLLMRGRDFPIVLLAGNAGSAGHPGGTEAAPAR